MEHPHYEKHIPQISVQCMITVAAAAFLLWEWLIMLDDELNCIWTRSNTMLIKWLYLFSRYFALAAQIMTVSIVMKLSTRPNIAKGICRAWISLRAVTLGSLFIALSMMISIRVYALYNRSRRIGVLLALLSVVRAVLLVLHGRQVILAIEFGQHCQVPKPPITDTVYLSGISGLGAIDIIVAVMTLMKYISIRGGWGQTSLGSLFVRDGVITYTVILVLALALVGANLPDTSGLSNNDLFHILFSLFVPTLSTSVSKKLSGRVLLD